MGRGLGEGGHWRGEGRGGGAEEGSSHRLGPPRTRPRAGAREARLCPALQMKSFIYMASLQPGPAGRGQLQGTGEEAQRKHRVGSGTASPEWTGPGPERRHEALGIQSQGRGWPPGRRQCEVSSGGSGWGQHCCSSAHRKAGPHRGGTASCTPGGGWRYWW